MPPPVDYTWINLPGDRKILIFQSAVRIAIVMIAIALLLTIISLRTFFGAVFSFFFAYAMTSDIQAAVTLL